MKSVILKAAFFSKPTSRAECNFSPVHFEQLSDNKIKIWPRKASKDSLACNEDDFHYKNTRWSMTPASTRRRIVQDFRWMRWPDSSCSSVAQVCLQSRSMTWSCKCTATTLALQRLELWHYGYHQTRRKRTTRTTMPTMGTMTRTSTSTTTAVGIKMMAMKTIHGGMAMMEMKKENGSWSTTRTLKARTGSNSGMMMIPGITMRSRPRMRRMNQCQWMEIPLQKKRQRPRRRSITVAKDRPMMDASIVAPSGIAWKIAQWRLNKRGNIIKVMVEKERATRAITKEKARARPGDGDPLERARARPRASMASMGKEKEKENQRKAMVVVAGMPRDQIGASTSQMASLMGQPRSPRRWSRTPKSSRSTHHRRSTTWPFRSRHRARPRTLLRPWRRSWRRSIWQLSTLPSTSTSRWTTSWWRVRREGVWW